MPSTKSIKQRIKSVKSTAQITKAMEVVSATKMRKSQQFALAARPYAVASLEMLQNILTRTEKLPPLLTTREVKHALLLVVTSDKGLAGALNANVIKKAEQWIEARRLEGVSFSLITVGKKARDYFLRRDIPIRESFTGFGDFTTFSQTLPIAQILLKGFQDGQWDSIDAVSMNFRTTLVQEAVVKKILPATPEGLEDAVRGILPEAGRFAASKLPRADKSPYRYEYVLEPSPEILLAAIVPDLIRMHLHHIILEANASEHSARMVAMKSASDNARDLITSLTRGYNKVRQAGITRELTEITAGKEALEE
ncbi:MAG: ATP synthase F1 subunit gamma [bacterium]|nr:ATP synthase F1 subunit gamma [bacterium]